MLSEIEYNHLKNWYKEKYPLSIDLSFIEKLYQKLHPVALSDWRNFFAQKMNIKTVIKLRKGLV